MEKMVKRSLTLVLALVLLPAFVWAGGSPEKSQAKAAEKIVLKMADNFPDRANTSGAVVDQINAEFMKSHPNVTIEVESYQDQPYQQKIKLYATSNQLPDFFKYWSFSTLLKPLVDSNLVLELNKAEFDKYNFIAGSLETNMYNGKLYGIPASADLWIVYYNKRLFREAGVEIPATMDELLATVPKFKAKGIIPVTTDGKDAWPLNITYDNLVGRITGDFTVIQKALDRTMKFTDAPFVQAAKLLQGAVKAGLFNEDLITSDYGASRNLFGQERAAMYIMGAWELGLATDTNFSQSFRDNVGVFKFPVVTGGKGTQDDLMAWFGGNWVVSARSRYKELGVEYLKYYAERFPTLIWEKKGAVPAQVVAATASDSELSKAILKVASDAKQTSGTPSIDRSTPAFKEDAQKFVRELAGNIVTPEEFCRKLDAAAETASKQ